VGSRKSQYYYCHTREHIGGDEISFCLLQVLDRNAPATRESQRQSRFSRRDTPALPIWRRVLPAVVEADPARLVKLLPSLAGRITQLKMRLSQQVEGGEPLVVLDSSD
jgi:hypothetical protein